MSFSIIVFLMFVLWPFFVFGLIKNKKTVLFVSILPALLIGFIVGFLYLENQHVSTPHTDLSAEKLGGVSIVSDFDLKKYMRNYWEKGKRKRTIFISTLFNTRTS